MGETNSNSNRGEEVVDTLGMKRRVMHMFLVKTNITEITEVALIRVRQKSHNGINKQSGIRT